MLGKFASCVAVLLKTETLAAVNNPFFGGMAKLTVILINHRQPFTYLIVSKAFFDC